MYSVILAGGSGTRLRPISTIQNPKQFINFKNNQSLLQITAERILTINPDPKKCFVSTNQNYQSQTLIQLNSYHIDQTIIEPIKRNTAPAIACIVAYLQHIVGLDDNEIVLICPSDHYIHPIIRFKEYVIQAQEYARQGKIILFGILPTRPETGYGYIEIDTKSSDINTVISPIKSFKEKPDLETAQTYCDAGNYFWNAGIFMFQIGTIKKEFAHYCPPIAKQMNMDYDSFIAQFVNMPDIPIDIAIMEKTKKSIVVPMIINRSDIGSRDSMYLEMLKNAHGNSLTGNNIVCTGNNNLVYSSCQDKKIVVDGVDDLIVVESDIGLYITTRGNSQGVKKFIS